MVKDSNNPGNSKTKVIFLDNKDRGSLRNKPIRITSCSRRKARENPRWQGAENSLCDWLKRVATLVREIHAFLSFTNKPIINVTFQKYFLKINFFSLCIIQYNTIKILRILAITSCSLKAIWKMSLFQGRPETIQCSRQAQAKPAGQREQGILWEILV